MWCGRFVSKLFLQILTIVLRKFLPKIANILKSYFGLLTKIQILLGPNNIKKIIKILQVPWKLDWIWWGMFLLCQWRRRNDMVRCSRLLQRSKICTEHRKHKKIQRKKILFEVCHLFYEPPVDLYMFLEKSSSTNLIFSLFWT